MDAAPGMIRGDLAIGLRENRVHGSDPVASAQRETEFFLPDLG
jgi:nucleoside diphosphate kinase